MSQVCDGRAVSNSQLQSNTVSIQTQNNMDCQILSTNTLQQKRIDVVDYGCSIPSRSIQYHQRIKHRRVAWDVFTNI